MAMKPPSFPKTSIQIAKEVDDWAGIDVWIESLPIAYRQRHISIHDFGQISIRKHLYYSNSEYDKILRGTFKAPVYIFSFDDAVIICRTEDIKASLEMKLDETVPNTDGFTEGHYININTLPHLFITKEP